MHRWMFVMLVACACPSKKPSAPVTAGSGSAVAVPPATTCDGAKPKVEQLYRAEGEAKEPKRVDEFVADNVHMVMADCAKDPAKLAPCIANAASVADLEKQCLVPLDDEGTEGEKR